MGFIHNNKGSIHYLFASLIILMVSVFIGMGCTQKTTNTTYIEISSPPTADIISPVTQAEFAPGDTIEVRAEVYDRETAPDSLIIEWRSDTDGVLYTGLAGSDGIAAFSTDSLSQGTHIIRIRVTDPDGNNGIDSVSVLNVLPMTLTLYGPDKNFGTVSLVWSYAGLGDFAGFSVYRFETSGTGQQGTLLIEIADVNDTTYIDSLPPMFSSIYYQVFITNTYEYTKASVERQVTEPGGALLNFVPYDAVLHPVETWIYILQRNSNQSDSIVVIDYIEMERISSLTVSGDVGYMDIGDNGLGCELYLPMESEGWIKVCNDQLLSTVDNINVGDNCFSAVIDGRGHIIASLETSPWWDYPIRSFDRSTGALIDSNGHDGSFGRSRLRILPDKLEIIEISTWVSPIDLDYYRINTGGSFVEYANDPYHGDHQLNYKIFRVSPSGDFMVTSSYGAVYSTGSDLTYEGQLPRGDLTFSDFAFDAAGNTIYAAASDSTIIKIHTYPSLLEQGELSTRGYPYMIFRDDNKIISLSKPEESSDYVGIEIIRIN